MLEKSVIEMKKLALEIAETAEANKDFLEYKLIHIYIKENEVKPELAQKMFFVWEIPAGRRLVSYTKKNANVRYSGVSDFDFPKTILILYWPLSYSCLGSMFVYSLDSSNRYLPRWQTNIMSGNRVCLGGAGKDFFLGSYPGVKKIFDINLEAIDTYMMTKMYDDDLGYISSRFIQYIQEYHGIECIEGGKVSINPISLLEVADGKTLDWDGCFDAYLNAHYRNIVKPNSYWKQELSEFLHPVVDSIPENLIEHLKDNVDN